MITTLRTNESEPLEHPALPESLNAAALALDTDFIWQRIEAYVAHRWSIRDVEFLAEGEGHWLPPLTPVTISKAEYWDGDYWAELQLKPTPLGGLVFQDFGTYRFTGTAGNADAKAPANVLEAFKRLAEYSAQSKGKAGARSETIGAGSINLSHTRSPMWMAEAMRNSGAGDLLRSYRVA